MRQMPLVIGLTFDLRSPVSGRTDDLLAEHDTEETISAIETALTKQRHKVLRIGSSKALIKRALRLKCDIVFNIAEGLDGRNRESHVPLILDIFGIPYTGSDALTLSACLDKFVSKKIFHYHKIATPVCFGCHPREDSPLPAGAAFPLIVKPRYEGSAKGIIPDSKVNDYNELMKMTSYVTQKYKQPALIEEFISGWEFTIGVIGGDKPKLLPLVQRHVEEKTGLSCHIFDKAGLDKEKLIYRDFLEITPRLEEEIGLLALKAFKGFECRDFARMDFRVREADGKVYLLEINPLPSLAKDDYFSLAAELEGISYDDMINMILDSARNRYGL